VTFLHPVFLIGLTFLSVPIVIHLFQRKTAILQPFPTIEFIFRSVKMTVRSLKARHLLLLLSRIVLLILLTLSFSQPMVGPDVPIASSGPDSQVIVIDSSLSMRARHVGRSLFNKAIEEAGKIVLSLRDSDAAALLDCGTEPVVVLPLAREKDKLLNALKSLEAGYAGAELYQCLEKAEDILHGYNEGKGKIYLISDMRIKDWEGKGAILSGAKVFPIDVSRGMEEGNIAVTSVMVNGEEGAVHVEAIIRNFSPTSKEVLCRLFLGDDEKGRIFVSLGAWGEGRAAFSVPWEHKGSHFGRIEISHDILEEDDVRYFSFSSIGQIKALIVDGEPNINPYECESFYVERAFAPSLAGQRQIRPDVVSQESLPSFASYDIVFFLNIRPLPEIRVKELEDYIVRGGKVFFSMGENSVNVDAINKSIGKLLPFPLRGPKDYPSPVHLEPSGATELLMRPFFQEETRAIRRAVFQRIMLMEPSAPPGSQVLLRFEDGSPAIVEKVIDKGRVLLFASTMDRKWTDLPIRPVFLPLVHEISQYLVGIQESQRKELISGQSAVLTARSVVLPSGRVVSLPGGETAFRETKLPGIYSTQPDTNYFSVNVDWSESDLRKISGDELIGIFGIDRAGPDRTFPKKGRARVNLWGTLLFLLVIFLPIEAILSR